MKGNKKLLIVALGFLVMNLLFATVAAYEQAHSLLLVSVICGLNAFYFAFMFGKQEARGFVLREEDLPLEIYQVGSVVMYGSFAVTILRDKNYKILACKSMCSGGGFSYFSIVNSEKGQFFVPKALEKTFPTPALNTSLSAIGMEG